MFSIYCCYQQLKMKMVWCGEWLDETTLWMVGVRSPGQESAPPLRMIKPHLSILNIIIWCFSRRAPPAWDSCSSKKSRILKTWVSCWCRSCPLIMLRDVVVWARLLQCQPLSGTIHENHCSDWERWHRGTRDTNLPSNTPSKIIVKNTHINIQHSDTMKL